MDPAQFHNPLGSRGYPGRQLTSSGPANPPQSLPQSLPPIRILHPDLAPSGMSLSLETGGAGGGSYPINVQQPYQGTSSASSGGHPAYHLHQYQHQGPPPPPPLSHHPQAGDHFGSAAGSGGGDASSPDGDGDQAEQEPPKKKRRRQALSCTGPFYFVQTTYIFPFRFVVFH
jgi:hypothetical protein